MALKGLYRTYKGDLPLHRATEKGRTEANLCARRALAKEPKTLVI